MRFACAVLFIAALSAQKLPPAPADYGQWETLAGGGGRGGVAPSGLSPDGKWLAYGINRSNGENELRVTNLASGSVKKSPFGSGAVFSADSKWLAFAIGYSEEAAEKMRKDNKPVENKLGLMNLETGDVATIDAIQSFSFSPNGAWIAMRHYPPNRANNQSGRGGAAATGGGRGGRGGGVDGADENAPGSTLILRNLAEHRDVTFGSVSEIAWQDQKKTGHLLAIAISTEDKTGNGIQVFDTSNGSLRVLDSAAAMYSNLVWRKNSTDLAALKSKSDDNRDGSTYILMAWRNFEPKTYDPTSDSEFPKELRTVSFRKPSWSEDGSTIFTGIANWYPKPGSKKDAADDPPDVNVWHWRDPQVMAFQAKNANRLGQRNMLAAWHLDSGRFTRLGSSELEEVTPLKHTNLAYVADWKNFGLERSIGRPVADISLVDTATGARTLVKEKLTEDHYMQASPGGRYLLFLDHDQYWTIDTKTRAVVNITKNIRTSFIDHESDNTVVQKPPFGVGGWTKNDAEVLLYDKFDVWKVSSDGSKSARLTNGASEEVRHRLVKFDPEEESIDLEPVYLSLFGIWTKKSGYAMMRPGAAPERLVWGDKSFERLAKAADAPVYEYVAETFEESPNIFIGGADLKEARRVTDTNPFQSKYAWSKSELIEYKNSEGRRLQAALYYPAGYEPGKKYPMVVYMYEKLSDGLHRYNAPSERNYYSTSAFTSHGYFLLQPDIVFKPRDPGLSVADCVGSAVKKVLERGDVDKVGVIGHSWGGFDASFLATHTHTFQAAIAGAPITDLVSNYGNHHWSSGIAETDHIETGQQRMQVPLYEDLQAYIRNSAIFAVDTMTTPLMIEVGDADGTVFYHQGVELYNIARRARKNVVLLVYGSEDHGLRKRADQVDYQHRIFAWFGHYLKGEPAPAWITNGESYLDHQRELKKDSKGQ